MASARMRRVNEVIREVLLLVRALIDWSGAHLLEVDAARARFDQQVRGWGSTER